MDFSPLCRGAGGLEVPDLAFSNLQRAQRVAPVRPTILGGKTGESDSLEIFRYRVEQRGGLWCERTRRLVPGSMCNARWVPSGGPFGHLPCTQERCQKWCGANPVPSFPEEEGPDPSKPANRKHVPDALYAQLPTNEVVGDAPADCVVFR